MSSNPKQALSAALDLFSMPSKVRAMRLAPLPPGIFLLLRLAAEDAEALDEAQQISRRAPDAHRKAAIFFIEQILLASDSDTYRMLGLDKSATKVELRRHMVHLLKWLHPDRNDDEHKARLARRVLIAWNELRARKRPKTEMPPDEARQRRRLFHHARRRSVAALRLRTQQRDRPPQYPDRLSDRIRLRQWPR